MGAGNKDGNIRHVEQEVFTHILSVIFLVPEFRAKE
jgi:hypothetical protein